ncbi:MAG TPA: acyl-CoA dehydrogenase [Marmoricola sp.]|nr:acyl-CoA dehydrogenase [Marmoricola sp.]
MPDIDEDASGALLDDLRGVLRDVLDKGGADWAACADAGLLGLAVPAEVGGEGLGPAEAAALVHEAGRRACPLPLRETLTAVLTLARCAPAEVQAALLPRVAAGELYVVPAPAEPGTAMPQAPSTRIHDGRVTGRKTGVRALAPALLLVTAGSEHGPVLALVDGDAEGVTRHDSRSSSGVVEASYVLDRVRPRAVLDGGAVQVLHEHLVAGLLAHGDGLVAGALDLTAAHVRERRQFGRRLAEFQAVAQQVADVYIASRMLSLAAAEATRRVAAGEPAGTDLAIGAFWLCDRAPAALQTCHHLHGGTGVDETYPLHHFFSGVLDVARHLGGRAATLAAVPASPASDNLELTAGQRDFKKQARDYFATLVSDEDRDEMMTDRHGPAYHRTIKQMGSDGWMGVGWPTEYDGLGLGGVEQQAFANEAARADVHLPAVTLQTVGPTLQAFGTEKQKELFLSRILAGDVHFAIGYSEPDAGTDLASLRCSARKDGATGDWIVNGQKMWTTGGHAADYIWLAVRTDPDAPKHRGISVLIVDTRDPGYSWTPIITCDGSHHVNATYYHDVRVPADMLVGEENEGWRLITTQLNHERVMLGPAGRLEGLRDLVVAWARGRTAPDGTPLLDLPRVHDVLARVTASFRVNELLNWQVAATGATGRAAVADASASKVFASVEVQGLGLELAELVAAYGDPGEAATARLLHYLDATAKRNLVLTFGGGVNEVQRELVAMFGLDLPRVPR